MRRIWITLLAISMALVLALPAGAVKPDCSIYPEGHPQACAGDPDDPPIDPDDPLAGWTCAEADPPPMVADSNIFPCIDGCTGFDLTLAPKWNTCIDVESVAGSWTITVNDWGDAYEIALAVQDSVAPGDSCWGGCAGAVIITPQTPQDEMPFKTPHTPASELDACGDGFGDGAETLTFHAEAHFRPPLKGDLPAQITVTLPTKTTP
jgi:hypothetical protein